MSDSVFCVCLTLLVILFAGDTSLMDAIQVYLISGECAP
ncbi:hypothetical protein SAMN05216588_101236 [Pseudomonas flavescens]|uniref:Uncharacterized protein n=1 Tax=Phytopseudomonas flavescens TaxID=29435 RepID=A0A1G7XR64_9GAMM|nr:hypothetical protein SAMN05216588_101236 [Pseudomonas flavescens]